MSRPLIVHVLHRFDFGGLENGLVNIINQLPSAEFDHAIVTMTGFNPAFAARLEREVPIYSLNKRAGKDLGWYWRLFRLLRKLKPTIVHTRNLGTLEAQLPAWLAGTQYRIHGEHGWDVYDPKGEVRKYQLLRRLFSIWVHTFVPLSSELEHYLRHKVGIPARKIQRICNGVNLQKFAASAKSMDDSREGALKLPADWPFDQAAFVFGCVGRQEKIKGHQDLLQAFKDLLATPEGKHCRLCLVGDGSMQVELKRWCDTQQLADQVWFAGSRDDIPTLMRRFNCFVLPSHAEGISNTILEAMACGVPVIATRVGGNGDLVEAGITGLLVPAQSPQDLTRAMQQLASDRGLCGQMGERAHQRATTLFSLDAMINKYAELYRLAARYAQQSHN